MIMKNNPFENSKWIWAGLHCMDLINVYAQFRRAFQLSRKPSKADICITADAAYKLFVNGHYVGRGPARGWQSAWPFDRVDIAPLLRHGDNVIAVLAHNPGVHTCKYIHQAWAGFIMAGKIGKIDLATGPEWRVRKSPGHLRTLSRLSAQMEFQEHFDARRDDAWQRVGYDDSAWATPSLYKSGVDPWPDFSERGIPPLKENEIAKPVTMVMDAEGASRPLKDCVTRSYLSERRIWRTLGKGAAVRGRKIDLSTRPLPAGKFYSCLLDFGEEITGCLRLQVAGAKGGEIVDFMGVERLQDGVAHVADPDVALGRALALGSRFIAGRGESGYENFHYWGFRYLLVTVRGPAPRLTLDFSVRKVGYPLTGRGNFTTSSRRLNKIFECCYRSQQCCMTDAYMDCPGSEQAMWWGDAHAQSFATHYLTNDNRLFRRGIEVMARHKSSAGILYGLAPAHLFNWVMPDYTLSWIWSHGEYYRRTGDMDLFKQHVADIESIMEYYPRFLDARLDLLRTDERWLLLLDSAGVTRGPVSTLYNFFYLKALQDLAELYAADGHSRPAGKYRQSAAKIARALRARLFDRDACRFYGGLDGAGKPVADIGVLCDAFAVLTRVMPKADKTFGRRMADMCQRAPAPDTPNIGMGMFYALEAMKLAGFQREVIECIDRLWGYMNVEMGETATLEHWWNRANHGGSRCHAWSAHPILHFINIMLGVTQTGVAWRRFRFAPLVGGLKRVAGKVPTPHGMIETGWRIEGGKAEVSLKVPRGITAEIDLGSVKEIAKGPFKKRYSVEG